MAKSKIYFGIILVSILVLSVSFASAGVFDFVKNLFNGGGITGNPIYNEENLYPIARYSFQESSYSGTNGEVKDSINGQNGFAVGAFIVNEGIDGKSVKFDGVDDYIKAESLIALGDSSRTVSYWAKQTNSDNIAVGLGAYYPLYSNRAFAFSVTSSNSANLYGSLAEYDEYDISISKNLIDGKWHHIVIVYNNLTKSINIYGDGTLIGNRTRGFGESYNTYSGLYIGTWQDLNRMFYGNVDEVTIFNQVLTSSQINNIYLEQKAKLIQSNNGTSGGGGGGGGNSNQSSMNGVCGYAHNTCLSGTFSDLADNYTSYLWQCLGINGGINANCGLLNGNQSNQTCTDSDSGMNHFTKGITSGIWGLSSDLEVHVDVCDVGPASNMLYEYYCTNSTNMYVNYSLCSNGCSNGACLPSQNTTNQTNICGISQTIKQKIIEISSQISSQDELITKEGVWSYPYTVVREDSGSYPNDHDYFVIPSLISQNGARILRRGPVTTCYPCETLSSSNIVFTDVLSGETFTFLFNGGKNSSLVIDGKTFYLTYYFALSSRYPSFKLTWGDYSNFDSVGLYTDYISLTNCTVEWRGGGVRGDVNTCIDSDGGINYFVKGNVTNDLGISQDKCFYAPWANNYSGKTLMQEFYCNMNGTLGESIFDCPNGCSDGACISVINADANGNCVINYNLGQKYYCKFNEELYSVINNGGCGGKTNLTIGYEGKVYDVLLDESTQNSLDLNNGVSIFNYGAPCSQSWINVHFEKQVCENEMNMIKDPKDIFISEEANWTLNYNYSWYDEYSQNSYYSAGWNMNNWNQYNSEYGYVWAQVSQFSDKGMVENSLNSLIEEGLCQVSTVNVDYESGTYKNVYVCKNIWRIAYNNQRVSGSDYYNYENDITIIWFNDNLLFRMEFSNNNYDNCYDSNSCQERDNYVHQRQQENLISVVDSLINNQAKFEPVYMDYRSEQFVSMFLKNCDSQVKSVEDYQGSWYCKREPVICPEYGNQKEICTRYNYQTSSEEKRETSIQCSPGICSGCYVPRWFGYNNGDNVCIPYGTRLEQSRSEDIEKVEAMVDTTVDGMVEINLTIYDSNRAHLYFNPDAYDEGFENIFNSDLYEGETYDLNVGDSIITISVREIVSSSEDPNGIGYIEIEQVKSFNAYCNYDGNILEQKLRDKYTGDWAKCQNNYECASNLCIDNECVEVKAVAGQLDGIKNVFIKLICRISSPFDFRETYDQCVNNAIEGNVKSPMSCTDSDKGENFDVKGSVYGIDSEGNKYNKEDYCSVKLSNLQEYSCSGKESALTGYDCPYGCSDGACNKYSPGACGSAATTYLSTQTSYGLNPEFCSSGILNAVPSFPAQGSASYWKCGDVDCKAYRLSSNNGTSGGGGSGSGNNGSNLSLNNVFPSPFVKRGIADYAIVVGKSATSTDISSAVNIDNYLSSLITDENSLGSLVIFDEEVSSVSNRNLIVIGGACVNLVSAKLLGVAAQYPVCGSSWQALTGLSTGQSMIQTFNSPYQSDKFATLIAGYNEYDTANAEKHLETDYIEISAGKKYVFGLSNNPSSGGGGGGGSSGTLNPSIAYSTRSGSGSSTNYQTVSWSYSS